MTTPPDLPAEGSAGAATDDDGERPAPPPRDRRRGGRDRRRRVWMELAERLRGTWSPATLTSPDEVRFELGDWPVVVDNGVTDPDTAPVVLFGQTQLRVRAPFHNPRGLSLAVRALPRGLGALGRLRRGAGLPRISSGDRAFDARFLVEGDPADDVLALLADPELRRPTFAVRPDRLGVLDDDGPRHERYGAAVDLLVVEAVIPLRDPGRRLGLVRLFAAWLDRLVEGGGALETEVASRLAGSGAQLAPRHASVLIRRLERTTRTLGGHAERVGDELVVRVRPLELDEGEGVIRVALPALPTWTCRVRAELPLPEGPPLAPDPAPSGLLQGAVRVGGTLALDAVVAEEDAGAAVSDLVDLWQGALRARLGM